MKIDVRGLTQLGQRAVQRSIREPLASTSGRLAFVAGFVTSGVVGGLFSGHLWPALFSFTAVFWAWAAAIAANERAKFMAECEARIRQPDPVVYGLYQNGLRVGSISDAEYAELQIALLHGGRIAFLVVWQIVNLLKILINMLAQFISAVPIMMLAAVVFLAFLQPSALEQALVAVQGLTPTTAAPAIVKWVTFFVEHVALYLFVLQFLFSTVLGRRFLFGFESSFHTLRSAWLRRQCQIPGYGYIAIDEPDPVISDEVGSMECA